MVKTERSKRFEVTLSEDYFGKYNYCVFVRDLKTGATSKRNFKKLESALNFYNEQVQGLNSKLQYLY